MYCHCASHISSLGTRGMLSRHTLLLQLGHTRHTHIAHPIQPGHMKDAPRSHPTFLAGAHRGACSQGMPNFCSQGTRGRLPRHTPPLVGAHRAHSQGTPHLSCFGTQGHGHRAHPPSLAGAHRGMLTGYTPPLQLWRKKHIPRPPPPQLHQVRCAPGVQKNFPFAAVQAEPGQGTRDTTIERAQCNESPGVCFCSQAPWCVRVDQGCVEAGVRGSVWQKI